MAVFGMENPASKWKSRQEVDDFLTEQFKNGVKSGAIRSDVIIPSVAIKKIISEMDSDNAKSFADGISDADNPNQKKTLSNLHSYIVATYFTPKETDKGTLKPEVIDRKETYTGPTKALGTEAGGHYNGSPANAPSRDEISDYLVKQLEGKLEIKRSDGSKLSVPHEFVEEKIREMDYGWAYGKAKTISGDAYKGYKGADEATINQIGDDSLKSLQKYISISYEQSLKQKTDDKGLPTKALGSEAGGHPNGSPVNGAASSPDKTYIAKELGEQAIGCSYQIPAGSGGSHNITISQKYINSFIDDCIKNWEPGVAASFAKSLKAGGEERENAIKGFRDGLIKYHRENEAGRELLKSQFTGKAVAHEFLGRNGIVIVQTPTSYIHECIDAMPNKEALKVVTAFNQNDINKTVFLENMHARYSKQGPARSDAEAAPAQQEKPEQIIIKKGDALDKISRRLLTEAADGVKPDEKSVQQLSDALAKENNIASKHDIKAGGTLDIGAVQAQISNLAKQRGNAGTTQHNL